MTMAGEGNRFKEAGIETPKPLIEYNGKPLFVNSMSALDNIKYDSVTFVVRHEHIEKYHIDDEIKKYYPNAIIIAIADTTRGAAETAFIAVRTLILNEVADFTDRMLVMDCDVIVHSERWASIIQKPHSDGVLLSFKSDSDKYSYAKVDDSSVVIETAEKNPISDHALTSPYFIRKIEDFVDAFNAMDMAKDDTYKEMYMSVLYNFLISSNKRILLVDADEIISLGTPQELENANNK